MTNTTTTLPEAHVRSRRASRRRSTRLWWLTLICLLGAAGLVLWSLPPRGKVVSIQFEHGHGIQRGDPVRFRGIDVGVVDSVQLDPRQGGIEIRASLLLHGERIARQGTRFWIERPRINAGAVQGLDTLLGGRYLAVLPGSEDAARRQFFIGDAQAPVGSIPEGALEIVLECPHRQGLAPGATIQYRGIPVGRILDLGLAGDAATVEARAYIDASYRNLVRTNTRFWNQSGAEVSVGLTGVQFRIDDVTGLFQGSLALATPTEPGSPVHTGHRFQIYDKLDSAWERWQPRIGIGSHLLPPGHSLPTMERVALRWKDRTLGVRHECQVRGWLLPLEDGRYLGPYDLLVPPGQAGAPVMLDVTGTAMDLGKTSIQKTGGELASIAPGNLLPPPETTWPLSRLRMLEEPEDVLLVAGPSSTSMALPASRLRAKVGHWEVDPSLTLDMDHHGACAVAVQDGAVIGILLSRDMPARIVPVNEIFQTEDGTVPTRDGG